VARVSAVPNKALQLTVLPPLRSGRLAAELERSPFRLVIVSSWP